MSQMSGIMPNISEASPGLSRVSNGNTGNPTRSATTRSTKSVRKKPKITLEDLQKSDMDLVMTGKHSYCLMLEELEMADRLAELNCNRALDFVTEQVRFVSQLQDRRQRLEGSQDAINGSISASIDLKLRRDLRNSRFFPPIPRKKPTRTKVAKTMTAIMYDALKATVLNAAVGHAKDELAEKFNKHIRKRGLGDEEIHTLEEILQAEGADKFCDCMAKSKMFNPDDSLARLHALGQTVNADQLLAMLERNEDIPILNILEWKLVTLEELEEKGIPNEEVDPCKVDWAFVAERMEEFHYRYKYTSIQWYFIWLENIDERMTKEQYILKRTRELAGPTGNNFNQIANILGPDFTAEDCRTAYYSWLCDMTRPELQKKKPGLKDILPKNWNRCTPKVERIFNEFGGSRRSFRKVAAALTYAAHPTTTIKPKDLRREILARERTVRRKKLKFTEVEDILLLVTVAKLKPIIEMTGNFLCLKSYLPWRPAPEWRKRLRALARQWINARFTIGEDMKLIYLANLMPGRWVEMAKYFDGFDRKYCCSHYKCIRKHILNGETILDYHAIHGSKSASIRFPRIRKMINVLFAFITNSGRTSLHKDKDTVVALKPWAEFRGFTNKRLPTMEEIRNLLCSMDQVWLRKACGELVAAIEKIGGRRPPEIACKSRKYRKLSPVHEVRQVKTGSCITEWPECDEGSNRCDERTAQVNDNTGSSSERPFSSTSQICKKPYILRSTFEPSRTAGDESTEPLSTESPGSPEYILPDLIAPSTSRKHGTKCMEGDSGISSASKRPRERVQTAHGKGRKSGRLRKLRREVALSRWRKNKANEPSNAPA